MSRVTLLLGGPSNTKQVVRDGDEADVWLQGSAASQAKSFEVISPKLKVNVVLRIGCAHFGPKRTLPRNVFVGIVRDVKKVWCTAGDLTDCI
jgi:hypothetical protein